MKTKEQILDSKLPNRTGYPVETLMDEILSAMQEYADQQKPKFTPVSKMPKKAGWYLVKINDAVRSKNRPTVEIGECYKSVKDNKEVLTFQLYVTHWMEIPE